MTKKTEAAMLLTPRKAAMELAISPRHLWNLPIPKVRLGRAVRYDRRDIEKFIEESKAVPNA